MNLLEYALEYASWGWAVLPLTPGSKIPLPGSHGVKDATTDPSVIRQWWHDVPDANIGVAAGAKSNIIIFDVDPRNGGDETWDRWQLEHGSLPNGAQQLTAGGGTHNIAVYDDSVRSCKLGDGLDLLSDGRYFVAAPSVVDGREYEWEVSSDPFDGIGPFDIPPQWMSAYRARSRSSSNHEMRDDGGLIQGNRNDGLASLAGAMRYHGMTEAEVLAAISVANETRCDIPLPSSEVRQIARSVCRYDPGGDVAADRAAGESSARAILENARADTGRLKFHTATSLLAQPSPPRWTVKGWLPEGAVSMIYGESGAGKTFIALDIACSIAAGIEWCGRRTKHAPVIYMAGEGHYGLRQRIASWCTSHGVTSLDNLIVSSKAVDLDTPGAEAEVIGAVREITKEQAAIVFIDTVNNHMTGDENSAQETRRMLNSCSIVSAALGAGTCLVHHTGHASDSRYRARGSSAWKASLDASILVKNDDGDITVKCTKMKDAQAPEDIAGELAPVDLGWIDEDGEEIMGAVFAIGTAPERQSPRKPSRVVDMMRRYRNAWEHGGREVRDGKPYVSRSALVDYLETHLGVTHASAKQHAKASDPKKTIGALVSGNVIKKHTEGAVVGWTMEDLDWRNSMMAILGKGE